MGEAAPERFLKIKQLAELMGLKPRTLVVYRCKGKLTLPLEKKSGMLGCKESVYRAWMENKESQV
jgi:predicted DNA-binding transcriptional regulator AlpA